MTIPTLLPLYLEKLPQESFHLQLANLKELSLGMADWLPARQIDDVPSILPHAIVLPDLSGEVYKNVSTFIGLKIPIIIVTSEFATISMWDWEARDFLRRKGIETLAPTSLEEFHDILRGINVRQTLKSSIMLSYQDDLGAGKQADIFKKFFWYDESCAINLKKKLGVEVQVRSFKALNDRALSIKNSRVSEELTRVQSKVPIAGVAAIARENALRLKLAISDELDETPGVIAAGINCLNESATSKTTPCLAWNLLFEERGLIWGCEADLLSMLTKYLIWEGLRAPVMMSNLYPFLMGQAALKHEKIPYFPPVEEPENHILVAHCGFFGIVPQSWASQWTLREPVLEIVDKGAHAIDARLPEGKITIVKMASTIDTLVMASATLENYHQFPSSDCLNGGILKVKDGYKYVESIPSHHAILAVGDLRRRIKLLGNVLEIRVEEL
jgi:hypothetical protein